MKKGADGSRDCFHEIQLHVDRDAAEETPETKITGPFSCACGKAENGSFYVGKIFYWNFDFSS